MIGRTIHTLAAMLVFSLVLAGVLAAAQSQPQQNPPGQGQAQQPAENPPYVSQQTNPDDRKVEQAIRGEFGQDPHMAYSRVKVQATDTEVILSGTVLTATAKDQAEKIAADKAGGRKINNKIRVNPNIQPGPGL